MKKNFSLIEVVGSVVILAILLSIVFWGYAKIKLKVGTTKCMANFKTIYQGINKYTRDNDGYISPYSRGYRWPSFIFHNKPPSQPLQSGHYLGFHTTFENGYRFYREGLGYHSSPNMFSPYWGWFYSQYISSRNHLNAKKYFRCPDMNSLETHVSSLKSLRIYEPELLWTTASFNGRLLPFKDRNNNTIEVGSRNPTAFYYHFHQMQAILGVYHARKLKNVRNRSNLIMMQDGFSSMISHHRLVQFQEGLDFSYDNNTIYNNYSYQSEVKKTTLRHNGKATVVWANGSITQEELMIGNSEIYGVFSPDLMAPPPAGTPYKVAMR